MARALTVCSRDGCPHLTTSGRCDECRREADHQRGTPAARGYGAAHKHRFRRGVLSHDPVCVLCKMAPSTVADHWPRSRRELVAAGADPDDPRYGRGTCEQCHNQSTAAAQPGGWNASR